MLVIRRDSKIKPALPQRRHKSGCEFRRSLTDSIGSQFVDDTQAFCSCVHGRDRWSAGLETTSAVFVHHLMRIESELIAVTEPPRDRRLKLRYEVTAHVHIRDARPS